MTLAQGLLYALVPAAIGAAVGVGMLLAARRRAGLSPQGQQRFLVLLAMPATALIMAFVGAFATAEVTDAARIPLLALGAAGLVQGVAHGILASRRLRDIEDDSKFGRYLLPLAALETPVILALLWVMQKAPADAGAA